MKRLFVVLLPLSSMILVACPDGPGFREHRQDDAGDADADSLSDAAVTDEADAGDADAGDAAVPRTSALCGVNGRDDCGVFARCDRTLGCVECASDGDCPATEARCLRGTCVGCRTEADCSDPNARSCWATDRECHAPCTGVCPAGATCVAGACVGCAADTDCPSGACLAEEKRCVECTRDETCPSSKPRCRLLTGACVACTANEDCGLSAPICDPGTFTCRQGCTSSAQCDSGQTCDAKRAVCVTAVVDASVEGG